MSDTADSTKHSFISSWSFLLAENRPSQSNITNIYDLSSLSNISTTDIQIPSVHLVEATLNLVPKNLFIT
jgi:hypothetical protein